MKFSELLQEMFNREEKYFDSMAFGKDYRLNSEVLKFFYKDRFKESDAFSEVDSIKFVDTPSFLIDEDNPKSVETYLITDNLKFKGDVYIYSIALTGKVFDFESITNPVKDSALMSFSVYDPNTFTPKKFISLFFNPEMAQDLSAIVSTEEYENEFKKLMHETLDKVLDNPVEYQIKGHYNVFMRLYTTQPIECEENSPRVKVKLDK